MRPAWALGRTPLFGMRMTGRQVANVLRVTFLVQNLPVEDTDEDLNKLVSEFGEVTSAILMKVRERWSATCLHQPILGSAIASYPLSHH